MFPVFPALLVLVCACASSAEKSNDTAQVRMFVVSSGTYEPIDYHYYNDVIGSNLSEGDLVRNRSRIKGVSISEEADFFLRGSVSTILIPSFYTLVCLISVPINICAVVAFALKIHPKKPAAIFMLNLACADLLFAMFLPFKISYHFGGNNWIFGSVMCRVVTLAFYWNMYCSVLLIACISVDRLLAVVYPIDSMSWRRPRNAAMTCVAMWTLSFAGSVPLVIRDQTFHISQLDITTCHDVQTVDMIMQYYKFYFVALCCIFFFLPLLVTVVSYTRVIWALSRVPHGVLGRSRRRTRAVVMAGTVLVIFVLCFTPANCLLMAHYLQFSDDEMNQDGSYVAYLVSMCLGSLNCALDPLLYYFGSSQCQKQLSNTLRCQKSLGGSSFRLTSSSSSPRSSSRTVLKASRTESSNMDAKTDAFQANLNSQYNKLLV